MTDDRTRKAILARRARFLAAALATLPTAACEREKEGIQPDHAKVEAKGDAAAPPLPVVDSGVDARPSAVHPCLEFAPPPADAAEPLDAATPHVCLRIVVPRDAGTPHPCLKMAPPEEF